MLTVKLTRIRIGFSSSNVGWQLRAGRGTLDQAPTSAVSPRAAPDAD